MINGEASARNDFTASPSSMSPAFQWHTEPVSRRTNLTNADTLNQWISSFYKSCRFAFFALSVSMRNSPAR